MQYRVKAEIVEETTGTFMEVTLHIDSEERPNDADIAEIVISNISVVPLSIKEWD